MTNNQLAEKSVIQLLNSVKLACDNAERADNRVDHSFYYALTIALEELQERRKAERDSEPVILYRQVNPANGMKTYWAELDQEEFRHLKKYTDENAEFMTLYRHAQPAPVVPVVPDVMEPTIEAIKRILPTSNPDEYAACIGADMWNACRAAMLQAGSDEIGSWGNGKHPPSDKPSPIDHGYLPECECSGCKATARTRTEMAVNSLVIPNEMTSEQAYEIGYYYGDPVDVFARGANWMRQHIIDSTLAAAPQSPGSEPAAVPGSWIPVSERMPERGDYLVTDGCDFDVQLFNGEQFIPGFVWEDKITHWMPLPAAPKEVKGE
ncbi:DUF551 domain-containing protein [Klebsiella pneumoniae]